MPSAHSFASQEDISDGVTLEYPKRMKGVSVRKQHGQKEN